jgi:hypothetical protein
LRSSSESDRRFASTWFGLIFSELCLAHSSPPRINSISIGYCVRVAQASTKKLLSRLHASSGTQIRISYS